MMNTGIGVHVRRGCCTCVKEGREVGSRESLSANIKKERELALIPSRRGFQENNTHTERASEREIKGDVH